MTTKTTETTTKQRHTSAPQLGARTQAESPKAFYERLTKRDHVRRLLAKLAKR